MKSPSPLVLWRKSQNITQIEIAKTLNCTQCMYSKIENGTAGLEITIKHLYNDKIPEYILYNQVIWFIEKKYGFELSKGA